MNNIVIMNAFGLSSYAAMDLGRGKTAMEYAAEAALSMPGQPDIAVIKGSGPGGSAASDYGYPSGVAVKEMDSLSAAELVAVLGELSEGYDNIFYFYADCPLIDSELTGRMYENHLKYFSEYTFADGYPSGLSVEIIKASILPLLLKLAGPDPDAAGRRSVFSLIEKDINSFDIETEISPDDQRLLRVSLFPDTKRNFIQLKKLMRILSDEKGGLPKQELAGSVLSAVRESGEFLRSLPVFFEIQTTPGSPQKIGYFPELPAGDGEMSVEDFKTILSKISDFSEDGVISLSVRNEPSVHSSPAALAEAVLSYPNLDLLIETSGTCWKPDEVRRILSLDGSRITWIIDLDAVDPALYKELRGEGYDEACSFASELIGLSPSNVWVQTVRMKDNESDTENFYKHWKEKTNNVIIQKYDWCCGRLPQRKVTDLSPVRRLPCWHLKREMTVLLDGSVPLCRDDLDNRHLLGNLLREDAEKIWENGREIYLQHLREEYPDLCRNCDEYYTYNY